MSSNIKKLRDKLNAARKERGEPPLPVYKPRLKWCQRLPKPAETDTNEKGRQGDS